MGIYYDGKIYGVKWDLIIHEPQYNHKVIFEYSQYKPITPDSYDALEKIRAEFLCLSEEDKKKYTFFVYQCGTSTYDCDTTTSTFYTWMPTSSEEIFIILGL